MLLNKPQFYYLELTCNSCSLLTPNLHVPSGLHATISEIPATNHYNMESLASMLTLKAVAFSFNPPSFKKIHTHTHTPSPHPPNPLAESHFQLHLGRDHRDHQQMSCTEFWSVAFVFSHLCFYRVCSNRDASRFFTQASAMPSTSFAFQSVLSIAMSLCLAVRLTL